ncbi:uncharacterized protein LOC117784551 isoform X3 [Drosophila innubila]|uniref:uncharacterized protein LOC117784551 isoform X3 n=1 Tax=Drosophila innubila TaxID=198719 RepID=UPI00148C5142|nr:uncharacterized protein LOC117784551 isoform X3 [Drosophila innubila]
MFKIPVESVDCAHVAVDCRLSIVDCYVMSAAYANRCAYAACCRVPLCRLSPPPPTQRLKAAPKLRQWHKTFSHDNLLQNDKCSL